MWVRVVLQTWSLECYNQSPPTQRYTTVTFCLSWYQSGTTRSTQTRMNSSKWTVQRHPGKYCLTFHKFNSILGRNHSRKTGRNHSGILTSTSCLASGREMHHLTVMRWIFFFFYQTGQSWADEALPLGPWQMEHILGPSDQPLHWSCLHHWHFATTLQGWFMFNWQACWNICSQIPELLSGIRCQDLADMFYVEIWDELRDHGVVEVSWAMMKEGKVSYVVFMSSTFKMLA